MKQYAQPDPQQVQELLRKTNKKYRLLVLLFLDAGLRISEATALRIRNFDFQRHTLRVEHPKFGRTVPLTARILEACTRYWPQLQDSTPEAYLFPGNGHNQPTLSRKTIWRRLQHYSGAGIHPQQLRRYFGARLLRQGTDVALVRNLMGLSPNTDLEPLLDNMLPATRAIRSIDPQPWWRRWWPIDRLPANRTTLPLGLTPCHVGRKTEMLQLSQLTLKRVNVVLLGPQGIGKSHLLDNFSEIIQQFSTENPPKILRIDDLSSVQKTLAGAILTLLKGDKEEARRLIYNADSETVEKRITRDSIKNLITLLCRITQPQEYSLLIDDVTRITPSGIRALEQLKNHFHIVCAARQLKIQQSSFLSNFERIDLPPLQRVEIIHLIEVLTEGFQDRFQDFEALKNHVADHTGGIPLYIIEMIERYRKEDFIPGEAVHSFRHTAAIPDIDFTPFVLVALSSLMVLRYIGGEAAGYSGTLRLIGGSALVLALAARPLYRLVKKKYI